jgi:hypothetical protein
VSGSYRRRVAESDRDGPASARHPPSAAATSAINKTRIPAIPATAANGNITSPNDARTNTAITAPIVCLFVGIFAGWQPLVFSTGSGAGCCAGERENARGQNGAP